MRRVAMGTAAVAAIVAALIGTAHSQTTDTYPDRPIKVVVPAAAGGVTDTPARIVTNRMRDTLGQPFVVGIRAAPVEFSGPKASSAHRRTATFCFTSTPLPMACCRR